MSSVRAFVALGSNVGDCHKVLSRAVRLVADCTGGTVQGCSNLYASKAEHIETQPPFLNAVIQVSLPRHVGELGPVELLKRLKSLESNFQKSKERFGPRELDLDIISFGNQDEEFRASDGHLIVPHERAHKREFVLRPLCDIPQGKSVRLGPTMERADVLLERITESDGRNEALMVRNGIWCPSKYALDPERESCEKTMLMGILNVTPDSFSDGGRFFAVDDAVSRGMALSHLGVDVVDIGGESTRPNAEPVSEEEELERVIPVIEALRKRENFTASISIDTRKASVARAAVLAGATFINDEVGEEDDTSEAMLAVASELNVPIVTMHARGTAKTMEKLILNDPGLDIVHYVRAWLERRGQRALEAHHIPTWNLMVDPGLGFAKTKEQNFELLSRLDEITRGMVQQYPVLVGASRKRFLRSVTEHDIDVATSATSTIAALAGAAMVRVHELKPTIDALNVTQAVRAEKSKRKKR